MRPRVLALPGNETLARALATRLRGDVGGATVRSFPDGESYVRIDDEVAGRTVILACSLDQPNGKLLPLLLLAATARDLGAARVGLVAPYLAYMRQDRRFRPGEGITSRYVARIVSDAVDWLVTVDPHLHRVASLGELYSVPVRVAHAAAPVAAWLAAHVPDAVLIGPDVESAQWVDAIAARAGVPSVVLAKTRHGDRDVDVSLPLDGRLRGRTPVLIDDIVSTGHTMLAAIAQLRKVEGAAPVCIGIHGIFADDAYARLMAAGAARVVTCNTIPHPSNAIDVTDLVAAGVSSMSNA